VVSSAESSGIGFFTEAEVDGGIHPGCLPDGLLCFEVIRWSHDRQVVHRPQSRKIAQTVMGGAECALIDARTDADYL
jgi:formylmethanofuran:tetrahydromethanopterin formyltransferase